jgi:uncharacterized protein YijF (DUF1287 family)
MYRFIFVFAVLALALYSQSSLAKETLAKNFVKAAVALENADILYDGRYRKIGYPMGDIPRHLGVCSDVVIRAYRAIGVDLQKLVHEDMKDDFDSYPKIWGLSRPDKNIDHRRVPNLRRFFSRRGKILPISDDPEDYDPGDIVAWNLRDSGSLPHIGIVTNFRSFNQKRPLIMHNIGGGQVMEDMLFDYQITGHYRYGLD